MVSPDATYPAFAFSLWDRPDGTGTFAYKVLGKRESGTPLVLIHGFVCSPLFSPAIQAELDRLSAVGLVDWSPLAEKLAEKRPGKRATGLRRRS